MGIAKEAINKYKKSGASGLAISGVDQLLRSVFSEEIRNKTAMKCLQVCFDDVIKRGDAIENLSNSDIYQYGAAESVEFEAPNQTHEIPKQIQRYLSRYRIPGPFVVTIEGGELVGSTANVVCNDKLLLETATASRSDIIRQNIAHNPLDSVYYCNRERIKYLSRSLDTVVPLTLFWNSYHHWIINGLPRLWALNQFEQETELEPQILVPANPPSWQIESLELIGYPSERVIEWTNRYVTADRIIIPSLPRYIDPKVDLRTEYHPQDEYSRNKIISPKALQWLRKKATERVSNGAHSGFSRKVVISRGDVGRRMIKNRSQYEELLSSRGFKFYELEHMTVKEQVQLFSNADIIVGPHGMGFTNIVFSDDCKIIEIFGDNYIKPSYYILSNLCDVSYSFMIGEQEGESRDSSIDINISHLKPLLDNRNI